MKSFIFFESLSSILGRTKSNIWPAISSYEHKNGWPLWATLEHMFSNFTNLQNTRGNSPVTSLPSKRREILLSLLNILESRNHVVTNHQLPTIRCLKKWYSNYACMSFVVYKKWSLHPGWLGKLSGIFGVSRVPSHEVFGSINPSSLPRHCFISQFRKPAKQKYTMFGDEHQS